MLTSAGINKTTITGGIYILKQQSCNEQCSTRASWLDQSCTGMCCTICCIHGELWLYLAFVFKVQGYTVAPSPHANHSSLQYHRYKQSICRGDGGTALFWFRIFHSPQNVSWVKCKLNENVQLISLIWHQFGFTNNGFTSTYRKTYLVAHTKNLHSSILNP